MSNVKSQQAMTRKPREHHISQPNERNFAQFWSQTYIGFVDVLISFWDHKSKVKVTAGNDPKNRVNTISS